MKPYLNLILESFSMVNDFFAIGKPIFEEEIYRKILRSVNPRYHPKILAIEEYANMSTMTKGSLIGKFKNKTWLFKKLNEFKKFNFKLFVK